VIENITQQLRYGAVEDIYHTSR